MVLKVLLLSSKNYSEIVRVRCTGQPDLDTLKGLEKKATSETLLYNVGVTTPTGKLVGFGMSVSGEWDPILKPGYVEVNINVDHEWRNQGIGSWILDEIEGFAQKNHAKAFQTSIQDVKEKELEWAKKKGFNMATHTFESRLDISSIEWSQYDSIFKGLELSGIRFTTFAEYFQGADSDSNNRFWDFWWELVSDVPSMEGKPRPDNDSMNKLTKDFDKRGFILAVEDGRLVAMSMIIKETDEVCYNSMTGVSRDDRGKGLAQAVKIKAIEYALRNNVKYIRTHNNSKNAPMLSVNKKLGYKQKHGNFGLIKPLR